MFFLVLQRLRHSFLDGRHTLKGRRLPPHSGTKLIAARFARPPMPHFIRAHVLRFRRGVNQVSTAPVFAFAPCKVSRLFCPRCRDLIIAATKSQHVSTNEVRHWWACETCGYEFRTTVRWQSSPLKSVSTIEETVPQSLQNQKEHCPDGISSGV